MRKERVCVRERGPAEQFLMAESGYPGSLRGLTPYGFEDSGRTFVDAIDEANTPVKRRMSPFPSRVHVSTCDSMLHQDNMTYCAHLKKISAAWQDEERVCNR